MSISYSELVPSEKQSLKGLHSQERDKRIADKIKAVFGYDDGFTVAQIAVFIQLSEKQVIPFLLIKPSNVFDLKYFRKIKLFLIIDPLY